MILNLGCSQNGKSQDFNIKQVPLEKQITYALQLNMRLPYELYINDIKAQYDYIGGNAGVDLNPYLLKNGKCKIRIKIFSAFKAGKTEIPLDDLESCTILFGKYIKGEKENDIYKYNIEDFSRLDFKIPNKQITTFEQEWEVDITELPYELEGWSKGQDLRKLDQKVLEQKVVSYHKLLWTILNNGNIEDWNNLTKTRFNETSIFTYNNKEQYETSLSRNSESIKKYCTNNMIPLEDYEMKIYADGKIVTLERKNHTDKFNNKSPLDLKSWGVLIRKGEKAGAVGFKVLLYLPEDSNEFVIIRK
jgi:hypothetical protein